MRTITNKNKSLLKQAIKNNKPLDDFDTSKVTDMSYMFQGAKSFNQPLDNFDTSNVTDMGCMFADAKSFNQPLDNFNTSNVTDMISMFNNATNFNQPLDNFDTSKVTNMSYMFYGASSFNQPLDNFDTSKVIDMTGMFEGAKTMFIGYIMRFASINIFVYGKYEIMIIGGLKIYYFYTMAFDDYIKHIHNIKDEVQIDSAIDGFIVY